MRLPRTSFVLPSVLIALTFAACSGPADLSSRDPADGGTAFDGAFDSGGQSFLLQRIEETIPGRVPVFVDLIGSNVRVDETEETVSVDVVIRNAGPDALYAPAAIWLNRFVPNGVWPTNADYALDHTQPPTLDDPLGTFGFDYSDLLGDGVLAPEETSQAKTWIFRDPGLGSFSFSARAQFGMEPDRPVIAGTLFTDRNRNGVRERGEEPYFAGGVTVEFPDGSFLGAGPDARGRYRVRVTEPGLYRVRFSSMLACVACYCVTTPDPLEVLLTPGPDGEPRGFEHADFGIYPGPCFDPIPPDSLPPVFLTDQRPDEIDQDAYDLIWAELHGELLRMRVRYGGCTSDHPFTLYAGRGFMESLPVQTWMLLSHDDLGEQCRALFEKTLFFDLGPIQRNHIETYGEPGTVRIRFRDFFGEETELRLEPVPVTVTGIVTGIDDAVPVDGGVDIDLQLENGETTTLIFGSLFTDPPPPQWRLDLYEVIVSLELGDRAQATGTRVAEGISLEELVILGR